MQTVTGFSKTRTQASPPIAWPHRRKSRDLDLRGSRLGSSRGSTRVRALCVASHRANRSMNAAAMSAVKATPTPHAGAHARFPSSPPLARRRARASTSGKKSRAPRVYPLAIADDDPSPPPPPLLPQPDAHRSRATRARSARARPRDPPSRASRSPRPPRSRPTPTPPRASRHRWRRNRCRSTPWCVLYTGSHTTPFAW